MTVRYLDSMIAGTVNELGAEDIEKPDTVTKANTPTKSNRKLPPKLPLSVETPL